MMFQRIPCLWPISYPSDAMAPGCMVTLVDQLIATIVPMELPWFKPMSIVGIENPGCLVIRLWN